MEAQTPAKTGPAVGWSGYAGRSIGRAIGAGVGGAEIAAGLTGIAAGGIGGPPTLGGSFALVAAGATATAHGMYAISNAFKPLDYVEQSGQSPEGPPKEGIYEFPDQASDGTTYVGQSEDIARRLNQHESAGRLEPGTETTTPVPGGKTAREIAEHRRIQQLANGRRAKASSEVSNKRDPIGPARQHLLDDEDEDPKSLSSRRVAKGQI